MQQPPAPFCRRNESRVSPGQEVSGDGTVSPVPSAVCSGRGSPRGALRARAVMWEVATSPSLTGTAAQTWCGFKTSRAATVAQQLLVRWPAQAVGTMALDNLGQILDEGRSYRHRKCTPQSLC